MLFRRRFDLLLSELMPDLGILHSAAVEIKSSARLAEVLKVCCSSGLLDDQHVPLTRGQVVLRIGNTLNQGTFRGNAMGFQLDTLTKVSVVTPAC